jgi:outer membrane biogenesis lipoprotein LolB
MQFRYFFFLTAASLLLPGCAVTGDPTQGGIFWSETQAQERLASRQATLNSLENQTHRVERQNARMGGYGTRKQQYFRGE